MRRAASVVALAGCALAVSACATSRPRSVPPDGFTRSDLYMERHGFRVTGKSYGTIQRVYVTGSGSRVILLHELPGLREGDVLLGEELGKYFEVHVPLMFGTAGQDDASLGVREACDDWPFHGTQFHCRKADTTHPIFPNLEQLVADTCGDPAIKCGIVGMCLTGTMPLSLVTGSPETVVSLVLAQPTLPVTPKWWSGALDISDAEIDKALQTATTRGMSILLTRFEHDHDTRHAAFERLGRKIDAVKSRGKGIDFKPYEMPGHGHSTLIPDTEDNAVESELTFKLLLDSLQKKLPLRSAVAGH
jgi:hypothetical protein